MNGTRCCVRVCESANRAQTRACSNGPAGYDAGASFRSTHIPETRTTVTVLGNSSEGAWPVIYALADAMDGTVRGKFPDES